MAAHRHALARGLLLALGLAWAGSAAALNGSCEFRSPGVINLAFGALDPSRGDPALATATAGSLNALSVGSCRNLTMQISVQSSANGGGGSLRLKHVTANEFIPYALNLPQSYPAPGNNQYVTLSLEGSIAGPAYLNALAGEYTDSVVLVVTP